MNNESDMHVKGNFLAYHEKKLHAATLRMVEEHLNQCVSCSSYYRMMDEIVSAADRAMLSDIEPDPYLPSRVKALVEGRAVRRRYATEHAWVRAALGAVMLFVAVGIGIFLGQGIAVTNSANDSASIATTYLEAFTQRGFGDYLASAADSTRTVQQ
jgi:predicted anti-sigma-YlaC factor YlaD